MKTLLIIIAVVAVSILLMKAINRQEAYECAKWQEWDMTFEGFYYTDWQKKQCGIL